MTAPPCSSIPSSCRRRGTPKAGGGGVRREPPRPLRGHPSSTEEGRTAPCSTHEGKTAPCSTYAPLRLRPLPLETEPDHVPRHGLGLLHVREMARVGDLLEFRSRDRGAEAPAVGERREAVVRPPQKQGRYPDAVQPRLGLRVV